MIKASYRLLMPFTQIISKSFSKVGPVIPILQKSTLRLREGNWEVAELGSNAAQSPLCGSPLVGRP